VSCRLPKRISDKFVKHLHYRQQALFKTKPYVEGDWRIGMQFNVKEPIDIAEKLPPTQAGHQIKVTNLGKSGFYLYIATGDCRYFRPKKNEDAKIECSFKKDWLRLHYITKWRQRTLASVFGKKK